MSYNYQAISQITTSTIKNGQTQAITATQTISSNPETGTSSSVIIRELSENELSSVLSLESTQNYEITDEDRLSTHDFYSLMNSEDEQSNSESESDVEYHWFPSLLKRSLIEFLDDSEQEDGINDDSSGIVVQIEESDEGEEEGEDISIHHASNGKRYYQHHSKRRSKRPRKSEQVPVEVIHVIL